MVLQAELADYSPVKGCMVIRPNGFDLWERFQAELDRRFKETGHRNAYFPLFIPESFLQKEAEHVEGFAPLCAVVTHGGGKKLEENLYIRPTSETIMYAMYAKWISSYRDLPLLINQWVNIVRWEMRTRLFLRTTEFLWQEGHTAHATYEEAEEETINILDIYSDFVSNVLAIPVLRGLKTESEKFAGGLKTYCIEAMMGDKKALQAGTSHNLGQNFAKAFDVKFQSKEGKQEYVWQTSWGVSTRLIGALVMVHGDDNGLKIPPKIAETQVVVVPIWRTDEEMPRIREVARKITDEIKKSVRVKLDDRDQYSPGWKFNEWELLGVPIRIELGPKDIETESVLLVRRDTGKKLSVPWNGLSERIEQVLDNIQKNLFDTALAFRRENTFVTDNYEEFKEKNDADSGFFELHWCGSPECESRLQKETKATIRLIPFETKSEPGQCILCDKPSERRVVVAKAY